MPTTKKKDKWHSRLECHKVSSAYYRWKMTFYGLSELLQFMEDENKVFNGGIYCNCANGSTGSKKSDEELSAIYYKTIKDPLKNS